MKLIERYILRRASLMFAATLLPLIGIVCLIAAALVAIASYWAELRMPQAISSPAE